jgi:hypothetical protein
VPKEPGNVIEPGKWYLKCSVDKGWGYSILECDSLQMVSSKEAHIYINGRSTRVFGDNLIPIHLNQTK